MESAGAGACGGGRVAAWSEARAKPAAACVTNALRSAYGTRKSARKPVVWCSGVSSPGLPLLAILVLLAVAASEAGRPGRRPLAAADGAAEFRVCLDDATTSSSAAGGEGAASSAVVSRTLALPLRLGYTLAAEHIRTANCVLVDNCRDLVGAAGLNVTLMSTAVGSGAASSAAGAIACLSWGGHLHLLGTSSLAGISVPVDQANGILTGTSVALGQGCTDGNCYR